MIIEKVEIKKFRGLENVTIPLGRKITVISGHNGTMKTTLLGIIGQGFSISNKNNPLYGIKSIDGYNFRSQFQERFKISPVLDKPGEHSWDYYISNKDIYSENNGIYGMTSIYRDKEKGTIRFWSKKGKNAGDGYIQCPVLYLSLKRLMPIGEESTIVVDNSTLTDEEKNIFNNLYNTIFTISNNNVQSIKHVSSKNKNTYAIENDVQDAYTISAGQDNIGKILLALLSFRRLQINYPNEYKGGILLIDEIESSIHPSALNKLIDVLSKCSGEYKIQMVLTTHNHDIVIKKILYNQNKKDYKVIYIKKSGNEINYEINPSYFRIISELYLSDTVYNLPRIKVYTEDDIAISFLKNILPKEFKNNLEFQKVSLGCNSYVELVKHKFDEFTNSIIILDADQKDKGYEKKYSNILVLPGEYLPEKEMHVFLNSLPDEDEFWSKEVGGFSKQKCFYNYPNPNIDEKAEYYKKWYYENKKNFGNLNKKVIDRWMHLKKIEVEKFTENFKKAYNNLADQNNVDRL